MNIFSFLSSIPSVIQLIGLGIALCFSYFFLWKMLAIRQTVGGLKIAIKIMAFIILPPIVAVLLIVIILLSLSIIAIAFTVIFMGVLEVVKRPRWIMLISIIPITIDVLIYIKIKSKPVKLKSILAFLILILAQAGTIILLINKSTLFFPQKTSIINYGGSIFFSIVLLTSVYVLGFLQSKKIIDLF